MGHEGFKQLLRRDQFDLVTLVLPTKEDQKIMVPYETVVVMRCCAQMCQIFTSEGFLLLRREYFSARYSTQMRQLFYLLRCERRSGGQQL